MSVSCSSEGVCSGRCVPSTPLDLGHKHCAQGTLKYRHSGCHFDEGGRHFVFSTSPQGAPPPEEGLKCGSACALHKVSDAEVSRVGGIHASVRETGGQGRV